MNFDHKIFFDKFRPFYKKKTGKNLSAKVVKAAEFLLTSFENETKWNDYRHIAYALATIAHETAWSFEPVEEGYYLGNAARVKAFQKKLRYYPYFGRGYVQLTWEGPKIFNYSKASKALGVDFVKNPELTLERENAFKIMTLGMHEGWFTGKKLSTYINNKTKDYKNARRIINGTDKAAQIAAYAVEFEIILAEAKVKSSSVKKIEDTSNQDLTQETGIETTQTATVDESGNTTLEKEVTIKNEQDVNETVTIEKDKPYNESGLIETIKSDFTKILPANFGLGALNEYISTIKGWELPSKILFMTVILVAVASLVWFIFRIVHYLANKWKSQKNVELRALIDTDVTRKNLELK